MKKIIRSALVLFCLCVVCVTLCACNPIDFNGDFKTAASLEEVQKAVEGMDLTGIVHNFNKSAQVKITAEGVKNDAGIEVQVRLELDFLLNVSYTAIEKEPAQEGEDPAQEEAVTYEASIEAGGNMKTTVTGSGSGITINRSSEMKFYYVNGFAYFNGKQANVPIKYKQQMEFDELMGFAFDAHFESLVNYKEAMEWGTEVFLDQKKNTTKIRILDEETEQIFVLKKHKLLGVKMTAGLLFEDTILKMDAELLAANKLIAYPEDLSSYDKRG